MGGEPWCFPPDVIAKLTDYQIEHLYLKPAAKRAAEWEKKHMQPTTGVAQTPAHVDPAAESRRDTESVVQMYMAMGLPRATAEAAAAELAKG
jgi:hypothetical protein